MNLITFQDKNKMTLAVLSGRKVQVRIPAKLDRIERLSCQGLFNEEQADVFIKKALKRSPYKVGEFVAIAQPYKDLDLREELIPVLKQKGGWVRKNEVKPMYMKHFIKITSVRLERLVDISDLDCKRSGVVCTKKWRRKIYHVPTKPDFSKYYKGFKTPQLAYLDLFRKVFRREQITDNLYVYVYDFNLVM